MASADPNTNRIERLALYQRLPLPADSKCIRVLTIHAPDSSQPDGGPLRGTMFIADLQGACTTPFTALSYVWGQKTSAHDPTPIFTCNDVSLPITPNCHSALTHLRRQLGEFTIWVDAICINQLEETEKFQQIPFMGEIYSRATVSYFWLGEGTDATDRAIAWLKSAGFPEYLFVNGDPGSQMLVKPRAWAAAWAVFLTVLKTSKAPFPYHKPGELHSFFLRRLRPTFTTFDALEDLLTREWTTRIWTYQETMLSRNPIIICGNAQIHWFRFVLSMLFLSDLGVSTPQLKSGRQLFHQTSSWRKMALARDRLWRERSSTPACMLPSTVAGEPAPMIPLEFLDTYLYRSFLCRVIHRGVWFMRILNVSILCAYIALQTARIREGFWLLGILYLLNITNPLHRYASGWRKGQATSGDTSDDFVDAIIARKSLDPKDKAFGLYSVIGIKLHKSLPPPDNSVSLNEIYRDLTMHILQATSDLKPLFLAAGNGVSEQPSWVPNWSTVLHDWWMEPSLEVPPRLGGYFQRMTRNVQHLPATKAVWSMDRHNPNKLTVGGHHYCTITACFKFDHTKEKYDSTEKDVHEKHVQHLQLLVISQNPRSRAVFLTSPDDVEEGPGELHTYWFFLYMLHSLSPASTLSLMKFARGDRTGWLQYMRIVVLACLVFPGFLLLMVIVIFNHIFVCDLLPSYLFFLQLAMDPDMLKVHIRICNDLATSRRKIFTGTYPGENGKRRVVGICSTDVEVGDKVIITSGLPSLIIIRPHLDSFRLVSPAAIFEDIPKELKKRLDRSGKERLDDILEYFTLI